VREAGGGWAGRGGGGWWGGGGGGLEVGGGYALFSLSFCVGGTGGKKMQGGTETGNSASERPGFTGQRKGVESGGCVCQATKSDQTNEFAQQKGGGKKIEKKFAGCILTPWATSVMLKGGGNDLLVQEGLQGGKVRWRSSLVSVVKEGRLGWDAGATRRSGKKPEKERFVTKSRNWAGRPCFE